MLLYMIVIVALLFLASLWHIPNEKVQLQHVHCSTSKQCFSSIYSLFIYV